MDAAPSIYSRLDHSLYPTPLWPSKLTEAHMIGVEQTHRFKLAIRVAAVVPDKRLTTSASGQLAVPVSYHPHASHQPSDSSDPILLVASPLRTPSNLNT